MHRYHATISWRRDGESFIDGAYSRAHNWVFDGGAVVAASSSPTVVPTPYSVSEHVDPEEALVASAASCHMLWFLAIAAERGYVVDRYVDAATGGMERIGPGRMAITRIDLRPEIAFANGVAPPTAELDEMHRQAHDRCFIANSLRAEITVEASRPESRTAERSATRVVVASLNPVKVHAVQRGMNRMFPGRALAVETASVGSGVPDQPMSSTEALAGAAERARAARLEAPDADLWVGIEGGIEDSADGMAAFAWVVVVSRDREGCGRTATFFLPERIAELVRGGMELGEADDVVFGRQNSKQNDGAIGLLTDNALDRTALYEQGVVMALVPFKNPELFDGGSDDASE